MRFPAALIVAATLALTGRARADDVLHPGEVNLDRPTLVALGVQLLISGDDNHDARVTVRYRVAGTPDWRDAMPLFRVHPESVVGRTVPEQFAGSIFDLSPATTYEIELHATDADGPVDQTITVTGTTRPVPGDPQHPAPRTVSDAAGLAAALNAAQPGDVITIADGSYSPHFLITASGTPDDPIVIRGASEDGTILDGQGYTGNVLDVYGSFVHVERLTLENANRGLRFQGAGTEGNVARRVHIRDVRLGIGSKPDQRDFYLCDNVVEGLLVWPHIYTDDGGVHADDDGIHVEGNGHVVCHNQVIGFGDALKVQQNGARADDFYGNEVLSAYDNGIELDTSEGNTRAFRNRFTNTYATISFQPVFGGPVYAIRNVVVNVANEQLKFHAEGTTPPEEPSGMLVLHNTFVSPALALNLQTSATSHHFVVENNLFAGPGPPGPRVVDWTGHIDDGTFDHDGWFPDGTFDFNSGGTWGSFAAMRAGGRFEPNGVLLATPIFASGLAAPGSYQVTMLPQDVTLASSSTAVDRGVIVPNVNDGFTGVAPDLGALELGCPLPLFGVRPEGVDETNEPFGCGGPTVTTTTTTTSTTTTLPYGAIETTAMKLTDDSTPPINPAARRVSFRSSSRRGPAVNRIVVPAIGSAGDPTSGGGTLTVYNTAGSGEEVTVALPASRWSSFGGRAYRFRDANAGAPVSRVTVSADRISLAGGGSGWVFTLDEPSQGRIAVRLTLGSGRPWCAEAPAKATPSTTANDRVGRFVAQPRTPAPLVCPAVP